MVWFGLYQHQIETENKQGPQASPPLSLSFLSISEEMASFKLIAFSALLMVSLPLTTLGWGDDMSPASAPFNRTDNLCQQVECGRGTCQAGVNYPFNYICECDRGWRRAEDDDVHENLRFLPCIIPNCTLNYSCQPAPPPAPVIQVPNNTSFFDPCNWMYCGEGTCNRTSTYRHVCECRPGSYNLLNQTHFPCYRQCTIGSDCAGLGVTTAISGTAPPPGGIQSDSTPPSSGIASSFQPGKLYLMAAMMMLMAMFM